MVEELAKIDVLCASNEILGSENKFESFNDTVGSRTFNLESFL